MENLQKNPAPAIDGPCSFYRMLETVSGVKGFQDWLSDYHRITSTENLLPGFKFLIDSILKCFMNEIYVDRSLGLSEDEIMFRAQFKGVPLDDTPNTCDKTILLKRIRNHQRLISKAKSWEELGAALNSAKADLGIFGQLLEKYSKSSPPLEKEFVVQSIVCNHIFTFLNDTSHNICLAQLTFPSIVFTATKQYLVSAFPGYVYGLQYLWYCVIGRDEFNRTTVKELHLALDEEEVKKHPRPKSFIERLLDGEGETGILKMKKIKDSEMDEESRDFIEAMKRDSTPRSPRWEALDRFYEPIRTEIVDPRESRVGETLGMSHLLALDGYSKNLLMDLLDSNRVPQPEYISKSDPESLKKQLSLSLFWYNVSVLDTQKLLVFNGVPAFVSTLLGSVEVERATGRSDPVTAIIFKHPAGMKNQYDYSFGVLIPAFSSWGLSDYSGWLIFYNCATDHSGFGESLLSFGRAMIEVAKKRGPVAVSEVVVESDLFMTYLKEHSVSSVFDALIKQTPGGIKDLGSLTGVQDSVDDFAARAKGKLLEHVVHKWMCESRRFEKTACDSVFESEQIDCLGETKNGVISLFEVKLAIHKETIEDSISQIVRKCTVLTEGTKKKVESWLVVYTVIPNSEKSLFEKWGIFVQDNFRKVIVEDRCFDRVRKETLSILDWRLVRQGKFRDEF